VVHDRELLAAAAEQRVDAAEHRAKAEALRIADAAVSQSELAERIRQRRARSLDHGKEGMPRLPFGPGDGDSFYSPGMIGTASTSSRLAAKAREDLDREIEVVARALEEHGPLEREELKRLVGGRYWGPGRFRAALRAATDEGKAARQSRTIYGPPTRDGQPGPAPVPTAREGSTAS
jgi:hypothetical protein